MAALRGIHGAERMLLRAQQQAEITAQARGLAGRHAAATAADAQRLTSLFADRIARLGRELTPTQRAAAEQQIRLEEAAALAQMYLESSRRAQQKRRQLVGAIKSRQRTASSALSARHRTERATLLIGSVFRRLLPPANHQPRPAVRHVNQVLFRRRATRLRKPLPPPR